MMSGQGTQESWGLVWSWGDSFSVTWACLILMWFGVFLNFYLNLNELPRVLQFCKNYYVGCGAWEERRREYVGTNWLKELVAFTMACVMK